MKLIAISIAVGAICFFFSCKKPDYRPDSKYFFGFCKAIINGKNWETPYVRGGFLYGNEDSLSLEFEKYEGAIYILRESLNFQKVGKTGKQTLYKNLNFGGQQTLRTTFYSVRDDGDVICDIYDLLEADSANNHITIKSFNETTKEVRGTFSATYVVDKTRNRCRPNDADTIRIRNGEFHTKIFE